MFLSLLGDWKGTNKGLKGTKSVPSPYLYGLGTDLVPFCLLFGMTLTQRRQDAELLRTCAVSSARASIKRNYFR
jgi:hypothetical protein